MVRTETFNRRWVDYELFKSLEKGNKIIAVHINGIKDKYGKTKTNGNNPLYYLGYSFVSCRLGVDIDLYRVEYAGRAE